MTQQLAAPKAVTITHKPLELFDDEPETRLEEKYLEEKVTREIRRALFEWSYLAQG